MVCLGPHPITTPVPLAQSPGYLAGLVGIGADARQAELEAGSAVVLHRRLWPGLPLRLISRGPVWAAGTTPADRVEDLSTLARGGPCLITPETAADAPLLRAAGFRQILTPAHVAELALAPEPDQLRRALAGSWRNALRRAEAGGTRVQNQPFKPRRDGWLLSAEEAQRKARGYRALPAALVPAMAKAAPTDIRVLTARAAPGAPPLAALILLRHGAVATYHISWTSAEGRAARATHLLFWQAMVWAAGKGAVRLDLGTVDAAGAPGLLRFKLGTGAAVRPLGGTWVRIIPPLRRGVRRATAEGHD